MARLAALVMVLVSCSQDGSSDAVAYGDRLQGSEPPVADAPAAASATVAPARGVEHPPCELIPRDEIERIAGTPDGDPVPEGSGCWYYVRTDTTTAEWRQRRDAAARARASGMDERAVAMYHPTRSGIYVEVDVRGDGTASAEKPAGFPPGWDEGRISPTGSTFFGRAGYVRVAMKLQALPGVRDSLAAMAGRIRDRVPNDPIPHPARDIRGRVSPGPDPCSVLTRAEAELVLGTLVAAPFRTHERTPLGDASGPSCGYLSSGHRILILTPVWNYGGIDLSAARMVGGAVSQLADLPGIAADTLEGRWDEAVVDLTGALLLRRGGRVLGVQYLFSSTDASGALRLAESALDRMTATAADN